MGVSSIPASGGGGLTPRYAKFTSSGTFNLPDGYGAANPLVITIQVIGGGGAGTGALSTLTVGATPTVRIYRMDYFGQTHATATQNIGASVVGTVNRDFTTNQDGWGGGSGGIAQTQMALTGPLTITVGAAGTRATGNTYTVNAFDMAEWGRGGSNNTGIRNYNLNVLTGSGSFGIPAGGTGGTSTAGAVSATGGSGGGSGNWNMAAQVYFPVDASINAAQNIGPFNTAPRPDSANGNHGNAGQPAGSAGGATPLLGALAGGSGSSTSIKGAFGVGGIKTDSTTHTGVEGTGGGYGSIGASGAVIISYWA